LGILVRVLVCVVTAGLPTNASRRDPSTHCAFAPRGSKGQARQGVAEREVTDIEPMSSRTFGLMDAWG